MKIEKAFAAIEGCAEDELEAAVRIFGLAVMEEVREVEQYTCRFGCDHGEECRTTQRAKLRQRIEALS